MKMTLRTIAAATLAALAVGAQAAPLQTLAGTGLSIGGSGLQDVLFSVVTLADGTKVALGAHAYKNGAYLANDGTDTFYADGGIYAPDSLGRANWSFDFAYALGSNCSGCQAFLRIDTDPSAATSFVDIDLTAVGYGQGGGDSWNMMMSFLAPINFNPFSQSSTGFELVVRNGATNVVGTGITVNVPEPATLTLLGLGLAGLGFARRRKQQAA